MHQDKTVLISSLIHLMNDFYSGHTHDSDAYSPRIDQCGLGSCASLVDGSTVGASDGTIMVSLISEMFCIQ